MIRYQLFIFAALMAGVAIGFFIRPESEGKPAPETVSEVSGSKLIADAGGDAAAAALRARIRELEAQLARAREDGEGILSNAVERLDVARKQRERGPGDPREWMENMKKNDPERFVQMTNRIARWQQRRREQQVARADFLASVDSSRMSADARKTHETYRNLMMRRTEIEERMQDPNLSDEDRREVMDEMFAVDREMRQTGAAERKILMGEIAREVGLTGEDADALIQTVSEVMEATGGEGRHGGFHMPPPPDR